MRILLTVSYDGTDYNGWQVQPKGITVQQVLEDAIQSLTGESVRTVASGRTDAGVHALGQKVHFDTKSTIPPEKFKEALNVYLPKSVKVTKSELVQDDFNARFSAKKKTYRYTTYISETEQPLKSRYAVKVDDGYDKAKMIKASETLIGKHDFKCFLASGSSVKDTVREIYSSKLEFTADGFNYEVTGNGFLYNMVRTIVGTILYIGYGKLTIDDLKTALQTGNRAKVGKTMPPEGLCLVAVEYGE